MRVSQYWDEAELRGLKWLVCMLISSKGQPDADSNYSSYWGADGHNSSYRYCGLDKFKEVPRLQGVNFIVEAESKIDPLIFQLVGAKPDLIRCVYSFYDLSELSDTECQAFPVMQSLYIHVSRLYYILTSRTLDLGLNEPQRAELLREWTSYLALFREHPAMKIMHRYAITNRDFNEEFLELASQLMTTTPAA